MRLDLPPAFFLGAYIRLAMLGGLGLFVLGLGATFAPTIAAAYLNVYGIAQAVAGLVVFLAHDSWRRRMPPTEFDAFLRRAYFTLGALAFLAGAAVFFPLALGRVITGTPPIGETIVAAVSLVFSVRFARQIGAEASSEAV